MKDTKKAVRERNDTFREEFEKFLEVKFVNAPCNDETGCPGFMLNGSTVEVCDDCRNVTAVDKHGKVTSPRFPLTDEDAESFVGEMRVRLVRKLMRPSTSKTQRAEAAALGLL